MGLKQDKPPSQTSLLNRWLNRKKDGSGSRDIPPRPDGVPVPLSLGQQRLWFLQQLYPDNPFYHYSDSYRFSGPFVFEKLMEAMHVLARKHEIMRTTFPMIEGRPVQVIHNEARFDVSTFDLKHVPDEQREAEANALALEQARLPFDLNHGPLIRITLIGLNDRDHLMLITMHHIVTDKWSMEVLHKDLSGIYQGLINGEHFEIDEPAVRYADFAYWQRSQPLEERDVAYWKSKLAGDLPLLKLPSDYPRPVRPSFQGGLIERRYTTSLSNQLTDLAKRANTTSFVLLLSAFKVLLHKYSHQEDILVGTPFSNRDRVSLEKVVGFFNDTLVLRSDLSGNPKFVDLVEQVRHTVLEAFDHRSMPFESLVRILAPERDLATNPLFQVMFLYHKARNTSAFAPGLSVEYAPFDFGVSKFDLTLYVSEGEATFTAIFEYSKDLFSRAAIERLHGHLEQLLESIVADPDALLSSLSIISDAERAQILEGWNTTKTARPEFQPIHKQFEKQALENPARTALIYNDEALTYRELNARANAISARLRAAGVGIGSIVGICAHRSTDLVAGIMAILKTGAAYLPLDPEYPFERLQFMVKDAGVSVILAQESLGYLFVDANVKICPFGQHTESMEEFNAQSPEVRSDDLAYVIYTSGSTGKPKGVAVTHGNLSHSTLARVSYYPGSPSAFLLLSSFAFDSSVAGIFWTLSTGGALVLAEHHIEQDLDRLGNILAMHGVTHTLMLPSLYALLIQHAPPEKLSSLRVVIVAGEACSSALCRSHLRTLPQVELYNEYGPTEATVWCTVHKITPQDSAGPVPIGKPIANTQIYILDHTLQPVPAGVAGELFIGGDGVAGGYLNQDELTARSFVPNPFSKTTGQRLYRTGDLARYRADGIIEYLGRADKQVKIRGYRVELDEIREAILNTTGVRDAEVVVRDEEMQSDKNTDVELVNHLMALDPNDAARILRIVETIPDEGSESPSIKTETQQTFGA